MSLRIWQTVKKPPCMSNSVWWFQSLDSMSEKYFSRPGWQIRYLSFLVHYCIFQAWKSTPKIVWAGQNFPVWNIYLCPRHCLTPILVITPHACEYIWRGALAEYWSDDRLQLSIIAKHPHCKDGNHFFNFMVIIDDVREGVKNFLI